jgi:hypothetical protein
MAIYSGFTHEKWWFSIATLVYQRVQDLSSLHEALRDAEAAADELTTETTETHRRLVLVAASMGGWIHGESMANPLSPKSHILYTDIYIYYCFIPQTYPWPQGSPQAWLPRAFVTSSAPCCWRPPRPAAQPRCCLAKAGRWGLTMVSSGWWWIHG